MKLETDRLILRLPREEDATEIANNANNKKVSKYLALVPYPYSKEDAEEFIEFCRKQAKEDPIKNYHFAIELKDKEKVIGMISLEDVDRFNGTGAFGYWLGEKYWKKGIMTEAAKRLIEFSFKDLELNRLEIPTFARNKASQALAKKLGFEYEGRKRKSTKCKATDKIHDEAIYGLLREDWENRK